MKTPEQKEAKRIYDKQYREANKEKRKEQIKKWVEANKEKKKLADKQRAENNKEAKQEYDKQYREVNKEKRKELAKKYYLKNKTKIKEQTKTYAKNNRDKINERTKEKEKTNPVFKLKRRVQTLLHLSLKKKGYIKNKTTIDILGCDIETFKQHLEKQFLPWMNWDNYGLYNGAEGYGWDIDHTIPLVTAKTEADIIRLNHYTNLQPLCSYVNRYVKKDSIG